MAQLMENANNKIEAFKEELKSLMEKYGFGIFESDQYVDDEYDSTDHYFTVDGEIFWDETIVEILDSIQKDFRPSSPKVFIIN